MALFMFIPTIILCVAVFAINKSERTEELKKKLIARWIGGYFVAVIILFWIVMKAVKLTYTGN